MIQEFVSKLPFEPDSYQVIAMNEMIQLKEGENYLTIWPTGSGKSLIAEFAIYLAHRDNKRAIYTTPLKALSTEKRDDWTNGYMKGIKVLRDTGDDRANRSEEKYKNYEVMITTNERLDVILRSSKLRTDVFKEMRFVIVDEIHLLGSKGRGSTLEFLIMVIRELMPHISIIGLSATLPNFSEFADWMGAKYSYLPPSSRPIPLTYSFHEGYPNHMSMKELENLKYYKLATDFRTYPNDQFLIFCSSRIRTENLAKKKAGNLKGSITIDTLIKRKTAYHHAGLTESDRSKVETAFKNGEINYLFATPTLAQGINLPAKNVIMFDLSRWSIFTSAHNLIEHYEITQMAGRAGRRGFDNIGRVFFLGKDTEIEHAEDSVNNPRDMKSQIHDWLDDKVLALVASNLCQSGTDIECTFADSFMQFQEPETENLIPQNISFLVDNDFLWEDDDGSLYTTGYGNLASKIYIKPRTVMEVHEEIMKLPDNFSERDLIKAFLKNGEFLLQVRVNNMDCDRIDAARSHFKAFRDSAIVTVYNPESREYEKMELTENWLKALGLIFGNEWGLRLIGSKQELAIMKRTSTEMVSKLNIVLMKKPDYLEKMSPHKQKIELTINMLKLGTLDKEKVKIMLIRGISEVRGGYLVKHDIKTVEKFLETNNERLMKILKLKDHSIVKMKKQILDEIL